MLTALGWVAVVVLIAANAVFVAAEFGLTSVDRTQIATAAAEGDRRALTVQRATRMLSFELSGAQLGITISSLLLGFVAEPVIADSLHPLLEGLGLERATDTVAVVVALALATVAQLLFGELVPQNLALARPLGTSRAIVPLLLGFTRVFRPVIASFNGAANAVVRRLGVEPQEELRSTRSAAELQYLIRSSAAEGALPSATAELLRRTLSFGDKTAADVMTPRIDLVALARTATAADLLDTARASGFSRFPVHSGDLDQIDGVVHIKHAYAVPPHRRAGVYLEDIMVDVVRVPTTLHCDPLLRRLRRGALQLAVVIDEFGGTAGVVTLEDLVEEVTGQIRDEYDTGETPDIVDLGAGRRSVSGRLHRDEFAGAFGWDEVTGPFDTLAGLVLARLGHLPQVGESVDEQGWTLTVDRLDGRRIDRVVVAPSGERP